MGRSCGAGESGRSSILRHFDAAESCALIHIKPIRTIAFDALVNTAYIFKHAMERFPFTASAGSFETNDQVGKPWNAVLALPTFHGVHEEPK
jgi:hypothetical protein